MRDCVPAVVVEDVTKIYAPYGRAMRLLLRSSIPEPVTALDGVSLSVNPGEILAVVGPNGAGKSTLFRVLTGLTTPTSGRAVVMGYDAETGGARLRARVGFAPAEERTLLLRHTCRENLWFHGRLQGIPAASLRARIDATLSFVGLADVADRTGFALSTGMRARLQLARAILHQPDLLILDEPTAAVDPISARDFLEAVKEIASEGVAVLISSHRLEEIEALHDRVVLLDRGKVVYDGDLDELRARWDRPRVRIAFRSEEHARDALARLTAALEAPVSRNGASVFVMASEPVGSLVTLLGVSAENLVEISQDRRPLVDVLADVLAEAARS